MPESPVFPKGLFVKRRDNAPAFVVCNLSIKADEFYEFLKQNVNDKGYVNIDVKHAKSGKIYAQLDNWKPNQESSSQQPSNQQGEEDFPY